LKRRGLLKDPIAGANPAQAFSEKLFMGQLSKALEGITLPSETLALVSEADALLAKRFEQAKYIEHLEAEIAHLRKEKGISGIRDNLEFDTRTGTHVENPSGIHYCTKCLAGEKRHPMKDERFGWRCMVCGEYYSNPDKPPPVIRSGGTWGRR
jgi:hypothetical protein